MTTAGKSWSRIILCAVGIWAISQSVWAQPMGRDSMDRIIHKLLDDAKTELFIDVGKCGRLLAAADSLTRVHFPPRSIQQVRVLEFQYQFSLESNDLGKVGSILDELDSLRVELGLDSSVTRAKHLWYRCELLSLRGKHNEAAPYCESALGLFEKVNSGNSETASFAKATLARIYRRRQQLREAEGLLNEALATMEGLKGRKSELCAYMLYDLGLLYKAMNELQKAEAAFLESTAIRKEVLGEYNLRYAFGLNGTAGIYKALGNYPAAEKYYRDALRIIEAISGKEAKDYASTLNNLGGLFMAEERYAEAAASYGEVLELRKRLLGVKHPLYAASLNNYSAALFYHKDYVRAAETFQEASDLHRQLVGKDKEYGMYIGNLAECQLALGEYDSAEVSFRLTLSVFDSLGIEALSAQAQGALGKFLQVRGRWSEAMDAFHRCMGYYHDQMQLVTNFLSDEEIAKYQNTYRNFKSGIFSTLWLMPEPSAEFTGMLYDHILFEKDFILTSIQKIRNLSKGNDIASASLQKLKELEGKVAAEKGKMVNRRDVDLIDALRQEITGVKKELSRTVSSYEKLTHPVSWQEVQAGLKDGEAAVEFFDFRLGRTELSDSVMYLAMLLKKGDEGPSFFPLFEERSLADILSSRMDAASAISSLYAVRGGILMDEQVAYGDTLYRMIWAPLEPALKGVRKVYYSPSGLLHRLNLEVIPDGRKGKLMADRFEIRRVASTRYRPVDQRLQDLPSKRALLLGGLHYDRNGENADPGMNAGEDDAALASGDQATRSGFGYLPASLKEVDAIGRHLEGAGFTVVSWTADQGTEESLKNACGSGNASPSILHLATHGFYLAPDASKPNEIPAPDDYWQVFSAEEPDPLMRSGLALAGANAILDEVRIDSAAEDGIFTARELAQLDLAATRLVVLSACETAQGDLLGTEGVFGLQRAFRIAGAGKMMVSLWRVPDEATAVFMSRFYRECAKGRTMHQALRNTRRWMSRSRPFHEWGAWVLLE